MKKFNEYIETNLWLKKLMDELNEEDAMRLEDAFYAFKQHCTKAENLAISVVSSREEIDKLKHEIELWKKLYQQRGRIMQKWIEKYNLPIAKAVLDTDSHES